MLVRREGKTSYSAGGIQTDVAILKNDLEVLVNSLNICDHVTQQLNCAKPTLALAEVK